MLHRFARELTDTLERKLKDALEEICDVDGFMLSEIEAMNQARSPYAGVVVATCIFPKRGTIRDIHMR